MSARLASIYGLGDRDLVIGEDLNASLIDPADYGRLQAATTRAAATGEPFELRYRVRHAESGNWLHVMARGRAEADDNGALIHSFGVVRDLTETTQLAASEERYRFLLDDVHDGVFDVDTAAGVIAANDGLLHYLGVARERFGPSAPDALAHIHNEDRSAVERLAGQLLAGQAPDTVDVEMRLHHHSGEYRPVRVRVHVQRDSDRRPRRVIGVVTDISGERALSASEERYRFVVDATGIGIWDWDLANERLYWSDRALEMLGATQEQASSWDWFIAQVQDDQRARYIAETQAGLAAGAIDTESLTLNPQIGQYRHLRCRGRTHCDVSGQAVRAVGFIQDVTELREGERERRRLSSLLHDALAQEVATSAMYAEMAAASVTVPGQAQSLLNDMAAQLRRARDHMQLLMQSLDHDDWVQRASLPAILSDVLTSFELDSDASLHVQWAAFTRSRCKPHIARALYFTLRESFANIIVHANATRVDVSISADDDVLRVSVEDNGRGLPEAASPLPGLREEIASLGGELRVAGVAGGTVVTLAFANPFQVDDQPDEEL